MKLYFNPYLLFTALISIFAATGCGGVNFISLDNSSTASTPKTNSDSGNGGTYDGKLRVLHHYVRDFTCESKSQPESILIRKNATDWVIIRNTKDTCAAVDQASVNQVIYNDVTKFAQFEGNTYTPPKPYIVDPNEDPNLADVKLIDGVCEDINGKCSLRASIENAGIASWTSDVVVLIANAIYKIDKAINLSTGPNSHNVLLQGVDASSTVLDGHGVSDLLKINAWSGSITVDQLTFENAVVTTATTAAPGVALSMNAFDTRLIVSNSVFKNNTGSNTLYSIGTNDIEVKKSQFLNNASRYGALYFFTANSALIDQTTIDGSGSAGVNVLGGGITKMVMTNSFIGNGNYDGILLDTCSGCSITNTTIYNNFGTGLKVFSFRPTPNPDVILNNVTIANRLNGAGPQLQVEFQFNPTYKVILNNSILSKGPAASTDCNFSTDVNSTHTVVATNSLFEDSSCAVQGSGNIYGNAQLSSAANNGGPTFTLLPALTSPALNTGDPATCSPQDQRGINRRLKCDIGAVEIP